MATDNYEKMVPIQKTNVYHEVVVRINQLLDEGGFAPGDRLPSERVLSERLGVSRTTLRQGIKVLESIGRLETRVGSGTYVCPDQLPQFCIQDIDVNKKGIMDLITVRCGIENTALNAFFKSGRTLENIDQLELLLKEAENRSHALRKTNTKPTYKYDFEFEETIAQMTDNKILILQQQQIHALWAYLWGKLGFLPRVGHAAMDHARILDAIKENELELACIYMRLHVQRDLDSLFSRMEEDNSKKTELDNNDDTAESET